MEKLEGNLMIVFMYQSLVGDLRDALGLYFYLNLQILQEKVGLC